MSGITGAMYSAVSGLKAQATNLATISDNISNSNTVGYKRTSCQFKTMVSEAATENSYSTGGVQPVCQGQIDQQGTIQASSSATDIAINGSGFFATASAVNSSGTLPFGISAMFTRAGSFTVNAKGFLINSAGQYLLGVPAVNGRVPGSSLPINQLSAISVGAASGSAKATSSISIGANLAATAHSAIPVSMFTGVGVGKKIGALTAHTSSAVTAVNIGAARGTLVSQGGSTTGTTGLIIQAGTSATYTNQISGLTFVPPDSGFITSVSVFDSLGINHNLSIAFQKKAPNLWDAYVVGMTRAGSQNPTDGSPIDSLSGGSTNSFAMPLEIGTLSFTTNGTLGSFVATNGKPYNPIVIPMTGASASNAATFMPQIDFGQLSLGSNTAGSSSGVTQYSGQSAVNFINQDGIGFGYRVGVQIGNDGLVQGVFDNGQRLTVARIPVITFPAPNKLAAFSGNVYAPTLGSGDPSANYSQVGGAGEIIGSSLESSNVDLSTEFTSLISTQNNYSANARTITSSTNFLQEVINLIR